ncbi:MAG: hypothetical protein IPM54_33375 [Polyangiaceae bacterium]|nr:hypothetical protein [Polyangiaceae bacterium]
MRPATIRFPLRAARSVPAPSTSDPASSARSHRARYDAGPVLGVGGMGEVRLSGDTRIGRRVAKKTLLADTDSPTARARFLREARVQGQLEHPSIVPVYDLDLDPQGRPFFTMKRVRGDTLERVIEHLRRKHEVFRWTKLGLLRPNGEAPFGPEGSRRTTRR